MKNYEPATPRTALGALAFALTLVTFGVFVAGPAALAANSTFGDDGVSGATTIAAGTTVNSVRTLPAVEVVASRKQLG